MFNATPLLRLYSNYRLARLSSENVLLSQEKVLRSLLFRASSTKFGIDHGFSKITSIVEYQEAVPLRSYDDFWKEYWQPEFPNLVDCTWVGKIPYFTVSSGTTTGVTKYIPYTSEMISANTTGGLNLLVHHLGNRPNSKIFGGKNFFLGGSTDLKQEAPGVMSGDLSGIVTRTIPWWARERYFPSIEEATLSNWEKKIAYFTEASLKEDIRLLGGVPSWMLIFFDKLKEMTGKERLVDFYPNLELIVHGGVKFDPYRKLFTELLEGSHAETREVYPASEGFIAIQDQGYDQGLRLLTDNQIFFEFVPVEELEAENPTRHWVGNIQKDINYAVVMSTAAGLWSYIIGDTVKFVDTQPPRLLITGRTAYNLSAFGEHLIQEELDAGISAAADAINVSVTDFSVAPVFPKSSNDLGGHKYIVECLNVVPDAKQVELFKEALDKKLIQLNEDYEAHRAKGYGLKSPDVEFVNPGAFAAWMKSRGKLGGQNKVPRVILKQELFSDLEHFVSEFKDQ